MIMDNDPLNHSQPLYLRVAQQLQIAVDRGLYPAGSKLPSESQLVEELGVSRVTVRKALQQLNEMGYTYALKGKGTFVKSTKLRHDFLSMSSFAQEAAGAGFEAKNIVKQFDVISADADLAHQ
ncbi:GntR family transcriptional regulator [Vibrio sp. WXL103]|uniref:GntR family transcriptional regulator n=1 Tax=Vibrio sp. WXL103 TaxID=3450710 RepID=UPI003EC5F19A